VGKTEGKCPVADALVMGLVPTDTFKYIFHFLLAKIGTNING
jgi:hypothetical protein